MWLGDIDQLSQTEQHYLMAENIKSDHDVGSHFYAGQIEVEFTPPSREKALLAARHKMVTQIFEKLSVKLTQLDLEQIEVIRRLRRPILWNENNVGRTIDEFNKALVETINTKAIKEDLRQIDSGLDIGD